MDSSVTSRHYQRTPVIHRCIQRPIKWQKSSILDAHFIILNTCGPCKAPFPIGFTSIPPQSTSVYRAFGLIWAYFCEQSYSIIVNEMENSCESILNALKILAADGGFELLLPEELINIMVHTHTHTYIHRTVTQSANLSLSLSLSLFKKPYLERVRMLAPVDHLHGATSQIHLALYKRVRETARGCIVKHTHTRKYE